MRIAVLAAENSWYLRDLTRAAEGRHELVALPFSRIRSYLTATAAEHHSRESRLSDFDAVLVRTMPPGSLEQVVFRMDVLQRLEAEGTLVVNHPRAIEAAVDKYLALERLRESGLKTPATWTCQTAEDAMQGFCGLGGDVVIKPLFGSEGRGVARVNDDAMALRAFKLLEQLRAVIYLQQFIPHHGHDIRLMVIGDRVLGMKRHSDTDWRTNVSRGASPRPLEVDANLASMARTASEAIGAEVAGVDLLPASNGSLYAIEVNAVPGWKALAKTTGQDVSALVLGYLQQRLSNYVA